MDNKDRKTPYPRTRLFKSNLLEACSVVHPCVPAIIFVPILIFFAIRMHSFSSSSCFDIALGLFFWTFIEYSLHRYIFHLPINKPWAKSLRYIIHGIHHVDPKDPLRLVAPPSMSISFGLFFLFFFDYALPKNSFFPFIFGFTLGYLCYDYMHWLLHHGRIKFKWFLIMQKKHALHHYKCSNKYYGVSNPFWDWIFKTKEGEKH